MKNIGQYNQDLSVPRKKDIDSLETRVKTNEDNIAMAESDIEGLNTDVGTLKTDVGQVKTALNSKVNREGSTMYGNLSPYIDGGASLGTSTAQWKQVQAQNIYGNVNNTTSTFSEASSRTNISSGDKLSAIFGKIAKWFSDLGSLAFKSSVAKSDLANDVQTSLDKADSALQSAPVTSVNRKTGAVTLRASDIGALPLAGGTLTGPLVLEDGEAQLKIGEAGVIFNPSRDEPQIVISDSYYATQYISLSSSQTKIVGGTQFTNTNMTLAPNAVSIQRLEHGYPTTAILTGVADGVSDSDAVNLGQLNKASLNGPITFIFHNIVLKSSKELFPRSWYSCVYTGRIYGFEGSASIDTSKIKGFVAVGEMSGGHGAGPCSVAYSDGAVAITTLVTMDPTAPSQVKIPCLYWY